jgi:hypothetical protein
MILRIIRILPTIPVIVVWAISLLIAVLFGKIGDFCSKIVGANLEWLEEKEKQYKKENK